MFYYAVCGNKSRFEPVHWWICILLAEYCNRVEAHRFLLLYYVACAMQYAMQRLCTQNKLLQCSCHGLIPSVLMFLFVFSYVLKIKYLFEYTLIEYILFIFKVNIIITHYCGCLFSALHSIFIRRLNGLNGKTAKILLIIVCH